MQLTEQERLNLIRRQKAYAAVVKAHELIEEAYEVIQDVCSEAHQGSKAYEVADGITDKLKALESEALTLASNIFGMPSYIFESPLTGTRFDTKPKT